MTAKMVQNLIPSFSRRFTLTTLIVVATFLTTASSSSLILAPESVKTNQKLESKIFDTSETDPPRIRCFDKLADYDPQIWQVSPSQTADLKYAQNSSQLPEPLRGKIEGDGIFYHGGENIGLGKGYHLYPLDRPQTAAAPVFAYVRYYRHLGENALSGNVAGTLAPALDGYSYVLKKTENFEWEEAIFELLPGTAYWFQLGVSSLRAGDFFLLDKFIVTQGHSGVTSIQDVVELCKASPPADFVCEKEGSFSDTQDCAKFHVCVPDGSGGLLDNVFTCPETTVWCQKEGLCQYPHICPCTL